MKRALLFLFLLISDLLSTEAAPMHSNSGKSLSAEEIDRYIEQMRDSLQIPGIDFALINNGEIVYRNQYGVANIRLKKPVTPKTLFECASLSKPVFAYFVFRLIEQGILTLDTPLYEYLPTNEITDRRYQKITARHVLSHTTGLPNWRDTPTMTLAFDPGSSFSYSGEGYLYLANVVAHLTGIPLQRLDDLFQKEVALPLGLHHFHFIETPYIKKHLATAYENGQEVYEERDRHTFDPAGGLYASAESYARFLIALYHQKGLSRHAWETLLQEQIHLEAGDPVRETFHITGWSLGFALRPKASEITLWHGGNNWGYTASALINPSSGFGYVLLTNADQCNALAETIEKLLWK